MKNTLYAIVMGKNKRLYLHSLVVGIQLAHEMMGTLNKMNGNSHLVIMTLEEAKRQKVIGA